MMGDFLAYQYVIDLNYGPLLNFSEMEFIVPGPGARRGIGKCFHDLGGLSEADVIRWVTESQEEEFERRGLKFQNLWGRPLQLIDCQNLFCEIDKYARVAFPNLQVAGGGKRIKQIYHATQEPIAYWYPPKWRLNERIDLSMRS
jgi:5-hmdU DNA kinase-like protein